jgi:hypothetical protein
VTAAPVVHLDVTRPFEKVVDAIRATPAETAEDMADMEKDEAMTRRALDLLGAGNADAYDAALAALREDTTPGSSRQNATPRPRDRCVLGQRGQN